MVAQCCIDWGIIHFGFENLVRDHLFILDVGT